MLRVTVLGPGDETPLEAFLSPRAETSMFLRSNARNGGLVDEGKPFQATYGAVWDDRAIVAVAAHCWNGMFLVQAPAPHHLALALGAALSRSGRAVAGLSGPLAQVRQARAALGMSDRPATTEGAEDLFTLDLADLRVPRALEDRAVICRPPEADELTLLTTWRVAFLKEALGLPPGPDVEARAQREIRQSASQWLLTAGELTCATSMFNARLPDVVQIGGVFVPPELRGRGYARAVVAGSLLAARAEGALRALLFTQKDNAAARHAYLALGFRIIDEYGLVLFS